MHPIDFIDFDLGRLTPREAQFFEALLWIAGEWPRQQALARGLSFDQAAQFAATVVCNLLGQTFPDLGLRVRSAPRLTVPTAMPPIDLTSLPPSDDPSEI